MDNATSLSLARIAIGTAAWASPDLALRGAMLDATAPESPYLLRLFAARDIALGALTLFAKPERKPALLRMGMVVDALDAGAAALAVRAKELRPVHGAVLAGAGAAAVVSGVIALSQLKNKTR